MRRWIRSFFIGVPADFESSLPIAECVSRLQARTGSGTPFAGRVAADLVRLRRVIPQSGNAFRPTFVGGFSQGADGVVLNGRFTTAFFPKAFMTLWIGCAIFWTVLTTVVAAGVVVETWGATHPFPWMIVGLPMGGAAFVAFGIAFVASGWHLARGDMTELRGVIQAALAPH